MEIQGSKQVAIKGLDDKWEIIVLSFGERELKKHKKNRQTSMKLKRYFTSESTTRLKKIRSSLMK
jgi:hypothetical protein